MAQQTSFTTSATQPTGPVECLGMSFASDEERRAYFTERLREKLRDPEFRAIEGFPIGTDEDILALSDPPYYTACPNPFIEDFVHVYGRPYDPSEPYSKEPFAADVSEGKNDPIYDAHSYHTKVPHKAIMRYILHYTRPGDLVLDGFCGTGMTGVAAQYCGDVNAVLQLGYSASQHGRLKNKNGEEFSQIGTRRAVLVDLSAISTFITRNLNASTDPFNFEREAKEIVRQARNDLPWLYQTSENDNLLQDSISEIIYSVWSDVLICSQCNTEIIAWDVVIDRENREMRGQFNCPSCSAELQRRLLEKAMTSSKDPVTGETHKHTKQVISVIHAKNGKHRFVKTPSESDYRLLERASAMLPKYEVPTYSIEHTSRYLKDGNHIRGLTRSHHFYTHRNLLALAHLWKLAKESKYSREMLFILTGFIEGHANRRNRYIMDRNHPEGTTCGPLTNTMFVPELQCEVNVFNIWEKTFKKQLKSRRTYSTMTSVCEVRSSTSLGLPDASIDYIFTDPPFGKNIMYSDLNLLWESWLKVRTNHNHEAVINDVQRKGLNEYAELMLRAFREFYRVLKPGRWMTLEFHNSLNSVWVGIQEALLRAGFVVADVRVLDKKHGTIHQDSGYTVKQDLVISAYKPSRSLEEEFKLKSGSTEGVWSFIQTHLHQIPVFVETHNGNSEVILERQDYLLFDRMVAFHIQRGVAVPLSASEFYAGLAQRFPERDGMYFLPEQVAEYERKRMTVREVQQLEIFVTNESSAIQWARQQLLNKPQTLAELTPQFMRELKAWEKHEVLPELRTLLDENFLPYQGSDPIPSQIVAWMRKSADLRDLIASELASGAASEESSALTTTNPRLIGAARDRWYVPDPNKAIDLEKVRLRGLLKEFAAYRDGRGKLKQFRTEAVKAGFAQAWKDRDYPTIVRVAERLPESVLQEDPDLLMYYDNATLRVG